MTSRTGSWPSRSSSHVNCMQGWVLLQFHRWLHVLRWVLWRRPCIWSIGHVIPRGRENGAPIGFPCANTPNEGDPMSTMGRSSIYLLILLAVKREATVSYACLYEAHDSARGLEFKVSLKCLAYDPVYLGSIMCLYKTDLPTPRKLYRVYTPLIRARFHNIAKT